MNQQMSSLWEKDGITVVELCGTPEQMGLAHGRLLKEKINRCYYEFVEGRILPGIARDLHGNDQKKISQYISWCKKQANQYEERIRPEFRIEMRSLAKSSGLEYKQVLLMQTLLDIVELTGMAHTDQFFHSCTQLTFLPEATGGNMLVARNLDWPPFGIAHELMALFHFIPENGIPFWSLGFIGSIGTLTAYNHDGLVVTEESLTETKDVSDQGIPQFLLHREIAQFDSTIAEAINRVLASPRNNGYHTLISNAVEQSAITVLHSAHKHALRSHRDGICWGVETDRRPSRYIGSKMPHEDVPLSNESSDVRYNRMKQLISKHEGAIEASHLMKWLADDFDTETGAPGVTLNSLSNNTTLQSFIADMNRREFYVAMGQVPAPAGGYVKFSVEEKRPDE